MSRLRAYLWLILFVSLPVSLFAWGPIGHMTVGYVAYQNLTPAAKTRVRDLLKLNPEYANWEKAVPTGSSPDDHDRMVFMIATIWADDIKGDSKYSDDGPDPNTPDGASSSQNIGYTDLFRHRYWHFVDKPFLTDIPIPTPNAQTQIVAFRAVLASTQADDLKSGCCTWLATSTSPCMLPRASPDRRAMQVATPSSSSVTLPRTSTPIGTTSPVLTAVFAKTRSTA